jgi:hypothetical protein
LNWLSLIVIATALLMLYNACTVGVVDILTQYKSMFARVVGPLGRGPTIHALAGAYGKFKSIDVRRMFK